MLHINSNDVDLTLIEINIHIGESLIRDIQQLMKPHEYLGISTEITNFIYDALATKMNIVNFNTRTSMDNTGKANFNDYCTKYYSRKGFSKDKMYLVFINNK